MKREVEIILAEIFNNSLDTRESVQTLIHRITKETSGLKNVHVILNFDKIDFMSRSFADEFYKIANQKDFAYTFTLKNMDGDLLSMLKLIEKTQNKRSSKITKPTVMSITNAATLHDYAFSW